MIDHLKLQIIAFETTPKCHLDISIISLHHNYSHISTDHGGQAKPIRV